MADLESLVHQNFDTLFIGSLLWVAFWLSASVVYRIWRQKPIFATQAHGALFAETWTSGHSNRNIFTKLGGARNCLYVSVTPSEVQIQPHFPFTLMFLPELLGMELSITRSHIKSIEPKHGLLRGGLLVSFWSEGEGARSIQLTLRKPQEFLNAIRSEAEA
jgi:hypothetical protein